MLGYRAGVPVVFLHTVQYHPTGIVFPEQAEGILITEKFRGEGANLVNIDGQQFVNEREPRDVEAASIIKECREKGKGVPTPTGKHGVWLDSPMIDMLRGEGTVARVPRARDLRARSLRLMGAPRRKGRAVRQTASSAPPTASATSALTGLSPSSVRYATIKSPTRTADGSRHGACATPESTASGPQSKGVASATSSTNRANTPFCVRGSLSPPG